MRAIIYTRVSTDEQTRSGLGLEAQLRECREYVERQGGTVVAVLSDEGVSGGIHWAEREGLSKAFSMIGGTADTLVVWKRDRLARDELAAGMFDIDVHRKGGRILSATEGGNGKTDEDWFMRRILDIAAEYEKRKISARTKAALAAKRARGERVGHIPYGFAVVDGGQALVEDDDEQRVIATAKAIRASGASWRRVASDLNAQGITNRPGRPWNHTNVRLCCTNRAA